MPFTEKKIFIAGSGGMVGSAVTRELVRKHYKHILTPVSKDLDLIEQDQVRSFFNAAKPEIVVIAAAKVGGILANNTYRADFIYQNLMIESNVVHAAFENGVEKLILLGSSCIYPRNATQPMREEELLSGYLEPTNEPYAIAKIAGIKLCESYYRQYNCNFYSLMPTNLYGPNDNFELETSHVVPALIRKFHEAKAAGSAEVEIWGSGRPRREFMYVDDLAEAIVYSIENIDASSIYSEGVSHFNIGTGSDIDILALAELISDVTGFNGTISLDTSKPDGPNRKLLDVKRMNAVGLSHRTDLRKGLHLTYDWFLENYASARKVSMN